MNLHLLYRMHFDLPFNHLCCSYSSKKKKNKLEKISRLDEYFIAVPQFLTNNNNNNNNNKIFIQKILFSLLN